MVVSERRERELFPGLVVASPEEPLKRDLCSLLLGPRGEALAVQGALGARPVALLLGKFQPVPIQGKAPQDDEQEVCSIHVGLTVR